MPAIQVSGGKSRTPYSTFFQGNTFPNELNILTPGQTHLTPNCQSQRLTCARGARENARPRQCACALMPACDRFPSSRRTGIAHARPTPPASSFPSSPTAPGRHCRPFPAHTRLISWARNTLWIPSPWEKCSLEGPSPQTAEARLPGCSQHATQGPLGGRPGGSAQAPPPAAEIRVSGGSRGRRPSTSW